MLASFWGWNLGIWGVCLGKDWIFGSSMERPELRGRVTLTERMAAAESSKLRELLKIRDEDDVRRSGPVAACEKRGGGGSSGAGDGGGRRLLDIMREQEANDDAVVGNFGNGANWKSFVDRFRLRRAGNACAAAAASSGQQDRIRYPEIIVSVRRPTSASRSISDRSSELTAPASVVTEYNHAAASDSGTAMASSSNPEAYPSGAQQSSGVGPTASSTAATAAEGGQQARVSLMALLEQTDRQWTSLGDDVSLEALAALNAAELAAEDAGDGGCSGGMLRICCVCMVREKGAAFIPCGHTFCRRCSRELWVNRGSCPLCNGFILEILDIF